jgi:hypothetical protein
MMMSDDYVSIPRLYLILFEWKVYIHLCFVQMKKLISSHRTVNGISNPDLYESADVKLKRRFHTLQYCG